MKRILWEIKEKYKQRSISSALRKTLLKLSKDSWSLCVPLSLASSCSSFLFLIFLFIGALSILLVWVNLHRGCESYSHVCDEITSQMPWVEADDWLIPLFSHFFFVVCKSRFSVLGGFQSLAFEVEANGRRWCKMKVYRYALTLLPHSSSHLPFPPFPYAFLRRVMWWMWVVE